MIEKRTFQAIVIYLTVVRQLLLMLNRFHKLTASYFQYSLIISTWYLMFSIVQIIYHDHRVSFSSC